VEKWDSMNPNGRGRVLWIGASILGAVVVALGVLGGHTYWEQRKAVRERARELMHVHAEHARSKIINWNRANRAGLSEIERWMAESRPNAPGAAIGTGPLAALEEIMARHEFSAVQIETAGRPITVGTGPAGGHRRSPAHIGKSRSPVCILWRDGGGTYWCTYVFTAADSEGKRKEMRVHIDPRQNVFRFLCGFGPNMEWGRFALAQRRKGSVDVF